MEIDANYPCLVGQKVEAEDDTGECIFFTVQDPSSHCCRRIPELTGWQIRACFHGWVILSNHPKWRLWNPTTSKFIHFPHLILMEDEDILNCCLSSPPDDPGSIFLLTSVTEPKLVFCRMDRKRKKWTKMSYSKQIKRIINGYDDFLVEPTCFNGKVYALTWCGKLLLQLDIVVNKKQVLITLLPFVNMLLYPYPSGDGWYTFLKASCSELFAVLVCYTDLTKKGFADLTIQKPFDVYLYKLDMSIMDWVEMKDLKGSVFFVDMGRDPSINCSPAIESKLGGGYIHILHETGKTIYSYDFKDKTISMSSMDCLGLAPRSEALQRSRISILPQFSRLEGEAKRKVNSKQVVRSTINDEIEFSNTRNESHLLNLPNHVLGIIMEFCVGVDYLNFRATCKHCRSVAPVIGWRNPKALETYSLNSPWLMTFEKDSGIITFTDPMFGDKYFIKAPQRLFFENKIWCCRYGWLLMFTGSRRMVFYNPFTNDIRELPDVFYGDSYCFSEPPTSPGCMVVAFTKYQSTVCIHVVNDPESYWFDFDLDFGVGVDPFVTRFPTYCDENDADIYVLDNEGGLYFFREDDRSLRPIVDEAPLSCGGGLAEYFLVKCDQHLLLVIVGEFGESVEVFKLNESIRKWEKMDSLGRHMIYICGTTCLCMDAKIPEMENKIYFPRLHQENGKLVFYSLETCRFHTFNGRNVGEEFKDFFATKQHVLGHAWIEPNWLVDAVCY